MKHTKEEVFKTLGKYNMPDGDKDIVWEHVIELADQKAELLEALKEIVKLWDDPKNPAGAWDHAIYAIAKGAIKNASS